MATKVLLDNDVVIKSAAYLLAKEFLNATTYESIPPAMLGVGRYVVTKRATKTTPAQLEELDTILSVVEFLEPSQIEIELATELEVKAASIGADFDSGESQLLAILIIRKCSLFLTGDKRAILAMEKIAKVEAANKVACFEQLLGFILEHVDFNKLRARVCARPEVDKTMSICFGCLNINSSVTAVSQALQSYINSISSNAPSILVKNFTPLQYSD